MIRHPSIRFLVLNQLSFFSAIALCFWLEPIAWLTNKGVSYFGTHNQTVGAFATGLLISGLFLVVATILFPPTQSQLRRIKPFLYLIPFLLLGIVLTPYNYSPTISFIHKFIANTLFTLQFLLSLWLSQELHWQRFVRVLLSLEVVSGVIALFSLMNIVPWEVQGQLLFQLAFGIILIQGISRLINRVEIQGKPDRKYKNPLMVR